MPPDKLVAECAGLIAADGCRTALDGLPVAEAAAGVAIAQACADTYCAGSPSEPLCGRPLTTADVDGPFVDFVHASLLAQGVSDDHAWSIAHALPQALLPHAGFRVDVRVDGQALVVSVGPRQGPAAATARASIAEPPATPLDTLDPAELESVFAWLHTKQPDPVLVDLWVYDEGVPDPERMRLSQTLHQAGYSRMVACRVGGCD